MKVYGNGILKTILPFEGLNKSIQSMNCLQIIDKQYYTALINTKTHAELTENVIFELQDFITL